MITTGIIRQINISSGSYQFNRYSVELNIFQTPGDINKKHYTYEANCCIPGGMYQPYAVGDMVYVGFINENLSLPVILGKIYKGPEEDLFRANVQFDNMTILNHTQLSKDTTIGDVTYDQLEKTVQQSYTQQIQLNQLRQPPHEYVSGIITSDTIKEQLLSDITLNRPISVGGVVYNFVRTDMAEGDPPIKRFIYSSLDYVMTNNSPTAVFKYATVSVDAVTEKPQYIQTYYINN